MRTDRGLTVLVLVVAIVLAGCGRSRAARADHRADAGPGAASSADGRDGSRSSRCAPGRRPRARQPQRLRDPLGPALVVSPVDCFEGLPRELGDGYLIGAVGESATRGRAAHRRSGERA